MQCIAWQETRVASFCALRMKKDKATYSALRAGLLISDVDGESESRRKEKPRGTLCVPRGFYSPVEAIFEIERIPEASSSAKVIVFVPLL